MWGRAKTDRRRHRPTRGRSAAPAATTVLPEDAVAPAVGVTGEQAREAIRGLRVEAAKPGVSPERVRFYVFLAVCVAVLIGLIGAGTAVYIAETTAANVAADEATGAVANARASTVPVLLAQLNAENAAISARSLGPGFPPPANPTSDDLRPLVAAAKAVLYIADLQAARGQPLPGDTTSPVPGRIGGGVFDLPVRPQITPLPNTTGVPGTTTVPRAPQRGAGGSGAPQGTTGTGGGAGAGSGGAAGGSGGSGTTGTGGGTGSTTSGGKSGGELPAVPLPAPLPTVPAVPLPSIPDPLLPLPIQLPGVSLGVNI